MADTGKLDTQAVRRIVSDARILRKFPELRSAGEAHSQSNNNIGKGGCSGCRKRKTAVDVFHKFSSAVSGMSEERRRELSSAIPVHGRLRFRDRSSGTIKELEI